MRQDLRCAVRGFARSPGLTVVAVAGDGEATRVQAVVATPQLFDALGVASAIAG